MKSVIGIFAVGVVLASLSGCGNTVEVLTGGAGGTGSSGTGVTSTGTGKTSSSSTGTGGACGGFADSPGAGDVTVRFVNQGGVPIYLPQSCNELSFTIDPVAGPDGTTYHYDPSCLQTCQDLQTQPQYACGACAPSSFRLDPGTTHDIVWHGGGLAQRMMPGQCWNQPSPNQNQCGQKVDAKAGTYRIDAYGYSSCGPGCQCDANGNCNGDAMGNQAYPDPVKFNFPSDNLVEVVFGVCAFPCPGG